MDKLILWRVWMPEFNQNRVISTLYKSYLEPVLTGLSSVSSSLCWLLVLRQNCGQKEAASLTNHSPSVTKMPRYESHPLPSTFLLKGSEEGMFGI